MITLQTILVQKNEFNYNPNSQFKTFIASISFPIFKTYVEKRLLIAENEDDDENEIDDGVDGLDDKVLFADQLIYVSTLARVDPESSLKLLIEYLNRRVSSLKGLFANFSQKESLHEG